MKRFTSTIASKGHVTLPTEVREQLGLKQGDRVSFVIKDSGEVMLQVPQYPTLDALAGAAGKLDRPLDFDEMLEIARDDVLVEEYRRDDRQGC